MLTGIFIGEIIWFVLYLSFSFYGFLCLQISFISSKMQSQQNFYETWSVLNKAIKESNNKLSII